MGFWRDILYGPQAMPEVRSDDPVLPTPNIDTALIIPARDSIANAVSSRDALGLIAVYRAVNIISTAIMQLSLDAYRDDEQLDPRPLLLRQPDPDMNRPAFLEQATCSLALNGNAFWLIFRDNQGRVTGVRSLNPYDVVIKTDSAGNITGYEFKGRTYSKTEMKHLSLMRVPGDPRGRGPIQAAQAELRGAIDTRNYASYWFQESGVPTGILTTKTPLNAESAAAYKQQWTDSQGGTRGVAVLGGDASYQPVYLSPEDAQFIEGQQLNTTAMARLFGIPAHLMLAAIEGNSMTYSNISQAWVEFTKFTLARYLIEIEQAFSDLLPRGTEARFNLEGLLRPDVVTRYSMHVEALQAGFLSVNEVRGIENLPPAPDGGFKTAAEKAALAAAAAPAPQEGSDDNA